MTALGQGTAGLALVMCFALLRTGQVSAATILLVVQCAAVTVTAVVLHHPLMAIPPVLLGGGIWLMRHQTPMLEPHTAPVGGAKLGIAVGAGLALLCQSQGGFALPSAVVLLSILLAATRSHPWMQIVALVAAQNGLSLAGCLVSQPALLAPALLVPAACLALPLPLTAGLLIPAVASATPHDRPRFRLAGLARMTPLLGWIDLCFALAILTTTLIVPLDTMATVFAPLLGLDGVLRSCARRNRTALSTIRRGGALMQSGLTVLAVCAPDLIVAWLAVLAAIAMASLPTLSRRWGSLVLAFMGAGLSFFGMLVLAATPSVLGYFSLFAGFATIAAVVPDLAVVLVILVLRLATQTAWPPGVAPLGVGLATLGLLACGLLLTRQSGSYRATLLQLAQASIAAMAICGGQAEGRFAGLVLLVLLVLTRAAARVASGPAATLAMAGLGGVPPLGVFPGLVLVVLALSAHAPWLLPAVGIALIPIVAAGVPRRLTELSPRRAVPSIAWLPLMLAVLAGYVAPDVLVHWWRMLAIGRP